MPSPLAHGAVALAFWPVLRRSSCRVGTVSVTVLGALLLLGSLGPDSDIILSLLVTGDAFAMHGGAVHSLAVGACFGALFALIASKFSSMRWKILWLLGSSLWWSHVLLDACTTGRGVALLWPITDNRFSLPFPLFYGVRHSEPWQWRHHVLTIATELPLVLLVLLLQTRRTRRRAQLQHTFRASVPGEAPVA